MPYLNTKEYSPAGYSMAPISHGQAVLGLNTFVRDPDVHDVDNLDVYSIC